MSIYSSYSSYQAKVRNITSECLNHLTVSESGSVHAEGSRLELTVSANENSATSENEDRRIHTGLSMLWPNDMLRPIDDDKL
jgi:hypothetical protein